MDRGKSTEARGGLKKGLGGLKTDLVLLAPELGERKPDLAGLDADLLQSAAVLGGLKPHLVRQKKVGSGYEEVLGG